MTRTSPGRRFGYTSLPVYFLANLSMCVFRILNAECNIRIAPHIAVFHAAFGAVDDDMGSVEFTPYGRDLWRPVAHERRQLSERFLLEKIGEIVGNSGHMFQLLHMMA